MSSASMLSSCALTLWLCLPTWSALAQDSGRNETKPEWDSVHLLEGQPAPFDGQLAGVELAITLTQAADTCERVTEREVRFAQKLKDVDLRRAREHHKIDLDRDAAKIDALERQLSFWRSPAFVAPASVVGTLLFVALTVWIYSEVSDAIDR